MIRGELQEAMERRIMEGTRYRGVPALMNPMDAWAYAELIHELRPAFVVEIGTRYGGSLLYLADLVSRQRDGLAIGVDIDHTEVAPEVKEHRRVRLVTGDALDVFPYMQTMIGGETTLVIEDSAHTAEHTLAVLGRYGSLVRPGGYMVCEDGVMAEVARALDVFLDGNDEWQADRGREWPLSWNPNGYLRRTQ